MYKLFSSFKIAPFVIFFILNNTFVSITVDGGDGGDYLRAIIEGGIPHASGYPLYTGLGILFDRLIPFGTTAWKVGLVSSLFLSLSGFIFYLLSYRLTKNVFLSYIASFSFLFLYPVWIQGVHVEVFSLHVFFILFIFYKLYELHKNFSKKNLYTLFLLIGLSLSNNQSIILLFPSILIILFTYFRKLWDFRTVVISLGAFLIGLLPYTYMFYVALIQTYNPELRFQSVSALVAYIFRMNYGWVPAGLDTQNRGYALVALSQYIYHHVPFIIIILSIIGYIHIFRINKVFFSSLLTAFFFFGPFYILYANMQIYNEYYLFVLERFYLATIVILMFGFAPGLLQFINFTNSVIMQKVAIERVSFYTRLIIGFLFLIPLLLFIKNSSKVNISHVFAGDNIAYDIVKTIPNKSILFFDSDTMVYNTTYILARDKVKKDIIIAKQDEIDKLLKLDKNNQAKKELERKYPKLKENAIDFLRLLIIPHNRIIMSTYKIALPADLEEIYEWKPEGLLLKLIQKNERPKKEEYIAFQKELYDSYSIPFSNESAYTENLIMLDIKNIYAGSFLNVGRYIYNAYGDKETFKQYIDSSLKVKPDNPPAYEQLGNYYFIKRDCVNAEEAFLQLLDYKPNSKIPYVYLYLVYDVCMRDKNKASLIRKEFRDKFNADIVTSKSVN